jgi:hypothetical protein
MQSCTVLDKKIHENRERRESRFTYLQLLGNTTQLFLAEEGSGKPESRLSLSHSASPSPPSLCRITLRSTHTPPPHNERRGAHSLYIFTTAVL